MTGTSRTDQQLLVVPQPRNRDLRLGFLTGLAQIVLGYIAARQNTTEVLPATRNREERRRYADAPQIIVPNRAARDYLGLLGRSTRFQRTDGPYPVDPAVPALGKWLTFLADSADQPGSALLADLTSLLAEHWATGQSPLEDASLAAQLAWIDPPPGMTGLQAALATEDPLRCPPAGPATDPGFDQAILEPLVRNYDRAAQAGSQAGADRAAAEITSRPQGPAGTNMGCGLARDLAAARPARDCRGSPPLGRRPGLLHQVQQLPRRRRPAAAPPRPRGHRGSPARPARARAGRLRRRARPGGPVHPGRAAHNRGGVRRGSGIRRAIPDHHHRGRPDDSAAALHRPHRRSGAHRARPGADLPGPHRQRVQIADLTRTATDADVVLEVIQGMGTPGRPTARRGTCRRGTGQLHARPRVLGPAGLPARLTRPRGRTAAPPSGRPPTRRGAAIMSGDRLYDPAAETDQVIAAVLADMGRPGQRGIIVDSPPGAGKTTLVVRAAAELAASGESCIIVAQTNNQVDDLTTRLARQDPGLLPGQAVGHRLHRPRRPARAAQRHGSHQDR